MIFHRAVRAGDGSPACPATGGRGVRHGRRVIASRGEGLSALGRLACVSARSRAYFCIWRRVLEGGGAAAAALIVQQWRG